MQLSFLQNELVLALCWTLIHSLWQGILLAIVTGAVMLATRKSNAQIRYRVLTLLFFLFMGITMLTFVNELHTTNVPTSVHINDTPVNFDPVVTNNVSVTGDLTPGVSERFMYWSRSYFNTHASLVVAIWFLIFLGKFIRLGANLIYVQRLKTYRVDEVADEWKEKLNQLVNRLGLLKQVRILESEIVKVPLVMGVLKPLILLPAGLLINLPADEIEAILLHELAHIQRRDYFVNLLQSFAETLFFFNPALMWLSSMIREERENCCDDIAIHVTKSKATFVKALIAFQEYKFSTAAYHVGFPGRKNQLLNRVKRIINERNKTLNVTEKSVLSFGMAVLILFSFTAERRAPLTALAVLKSVTTNRITSANRIGDEVPEASSRLKSFSAGHISPLALRLHNTVTVLPGIVPGESSTIAPFKRSDEFTGFRNRALLLTDTVPWKKTADENFHGGTMQIRSDSASPFSNLQMTFNENDNSSTLEIKATRKDGRLFTMKKLNGQITLLSINGEEIASGQLKEYASEINDLEAAYKYRRSQLGKKIILEKPKLFDSVGKILMLDRNKQLADLRFDALKRQYALMKQNYAASFDENNRMAAGQLQTLKKQILAIESARDHFEAARVPLKAERSNDDKLPMKNELPKQQHEAEPAFKSSVEQIRMIISDLRKEHINFDEQQSWFGLDNNQFVVDGKQISQKLHDQFKSKYVGVNGMGYYYGSPNVTGRGVFLDYYSLHSGERK